MNSTMFATNQPSLDSGFSPSPSPPSTAEAGGDWGSSEMVRCLPKGICSWNFWLDRGDQRSSIELSCWGKSPGRLLIEDQALEITRRGFFKSTWHVHHGDLEVMSASSNGIFSTAWTLSDPMGDWIVERVSCWKRATVVRRNEAVHVRIDPDHSMTRRSTIEILTSEIPYPTVVFCFWLVAHQWMTESQSA